MTIEDIKKIIQEAELVVETDEDTFVRLAAFSASEYDRVRKAEAKRLGINMSTLDKEVKQRRCSMPNEKIVEQPSVFPEIDPWPEPVSAKEILDELSVMFNRFAILPPHADTVLALWVMFTWCIDSMNVAPILVISSPEKQCGKTTVLSLLSRLVLRPIPTSNITSAALFRTIEAWHPTLTIDEGDTFMGKSEELRGILNSGHTRDTAFVVRTIGEHHEPKRFNTFGAKAIALIGKLPDTLHDRSIVVKLRRKMHTEKIEKLRHADGMIFVKLQSKLRRFARDHAELLRNAPLSFSEDISDRAMDNWEPLLAIAQLADQKWQLRAIQAARALSSRTLDATSYEIELLAEIKNIFSRKDCKKISSADLITELCTDEERPWATFNQGHNITPRQLSNALGKYGIQSKSMRVDGSNVKGYEYSQFEDAWIRYLPSSPISSVTPSQPSQRAHLSVADELSVTPPIYSAATSQTNKAASCDGVAHKTSIK